MTLTTIRPLMKKRSARSRERQSPRPIALVCVSSHKLAGSQAKEPDKLTKVRGKWAWCPSGAAGGHEWKAVSAGALDALRVQLVEVSRLVDVALDTNGGAKRASNTQRPKPRGVR